MGYQLQPRLAVSVGSAVGTVLVFLSYPGGIAGAYHDAVDLPALQGQLKECETRQQAIHQQSVIMAERIALKQSLIRDLIAGRLTLVDVTRQFHEMNDGYQPCLDAIRARYPDAPDDERMALNVLDFVALQEAAIADRNAVAARLSGEYHRAYGSRPRPAF